MDSTGAGDAFRGGFIAALLQHGPEDVEVLLRMANAVAALKCRTAGAREGLPHPAELDALLAEDRTAYEDVHRGLRFELQVDVRGAGTSRRREASLGRTGLDRNVGPASLD